MTGKSRNVDGSDNPPARPTIGLALGGGGARGLAHILVLEVFDEMGVKPDIIAGTSIGALFGAGYCSGMSAREIRTHMDEVFSRRRAVFRRLIAKRGAPLQKFFGALHLRSAILKTNAVLDFVIPPGVATDFGDLSIPLQIVATDFYKQSEVILSKGDLAPALCASMAIPGIFSPVSHGSATLFDGGLVNPLPYDLLTGKVDIVVAVDISGGDDTGKHSGSPRMLQTLTGALQILQNSIVHEKLKSQQPDILVELDVGRFHALDYLKHEEILKAASKVKDELRQKLTRVLGAQTLHHREESGHHREKTGAVEEKPRPSEKARGGRGRLASRLLDGRE